MVHGFTNPAISETEQTRTALVLENCMNANNSSIDRATDNKFHTLLLLLYTLFIVEIKTGKMPNNIGPWCPPCSPRQSKLVVHYELALQRYRNTRCATKASAGYERETHSEFSSYQVGASNTAVALPRLSPRTCHQRQGCSRKTAVDIASLQLRSEENLDHPGHSTKCRIPGSQ